jgi:hypothetical protein
MQTASEDRTQTFWKFYPAESYIYTPNTIIVDDIQYKKLVKLSS